MDTTAAAELGVGSVGAGVDGVGFWEWAGGEPEPWPEPDDQQQRREGDAAWPKPKLHHPRRHIPPNPNPKKLRTSSMADPPLDDPDSAVYDAFPAPIYTAPDTLAPPFQPSVDGLQGHSTLSAEFNPPSGVPSSFTGKGKGTGSIFFKTKLCIKFKTGTCPYNSNCTFAHGNEELRRPPPDWKDVVAGQETDRTSLRNREGQGNQAGYLNQGHKTRPCKRYYTDEGCPYGDRCIFLHDDQVSQARATRESNAISLGPAPGTGNGGTGTGGNGSGNWKNRMCNKWETTGHCPFGQKCHFAHGFSDAHVSSINPRHGGGAVSSQYQRQVTDSESKWKTPANEISTIYGDWIEDDEWESVTSSSVDTPLLDGRKDAKAVQGQQVKHSPSNQLNVPFFRGNNVQHDSSSRRDSGQGLYTEAVRNSHVFGSSSEHNFHGDGDLDADDGSSGEL